MEKLMDYYKSKWNNGFQALADKLSAKYQSQCVDKKNVNLKNETGYIAVRLFSSSKMEVSVKIEYDNTVRYSKNYKYGIYLGIVSDVDSVVRDIDINQIWEKYQEQILRSSRYRMENVFLHGDTNSSKDDSYWAFWIHLEDKNDLVDAFEPISVIVDSLIEQGFTLCHN